MATRSQPSSSGDDDAVERPPDEQLPQRQEDQSVPVDYEGSQEQVAPSVPGFDPENPTGPRFPGDPNTYPDPENPPKSGY